MSKLNSLNVSLDDQLKDYSFKRSFLKNHHPFRYWTSNKNLFIHLTYWIFFFWAFLVIFAIFVPINNTSRVGRGAMVVFETAFNYIVKIFRKHVRTRDNEAANLSPAIWSFESYLFLFWTIALILVSLYCRFIINNFIHEIREILREKNITHVEKKFKRFYKFIKILTIISSLLVLWTAFSLLYIKKPVNSQEIYTLLFKNPESTSRMYHRPLTKIGWITGGLNIFFFLVASFFYFKYSREKLTGNDFFFKCFRPMDSSTKNTIPVDLKIQNDIKRSLKVVAGQDFKKKNTEGYVAELKNVNKYFLVGNNQFHALKNVNLNIKKGEFIVILGYSGSGKTTLLNILAGIDRPTNGECILGDCDISKMTDMDLNQFRRKKIGYIFQNYALLPNLTAAENISITQSINKKVPVRLKYRKFKENMKVAVEKEEKIKALRDFVDDLFFSQANEEELNYLVDVLNLADHRNKYPHQLSGGQQQRVAIARAFIKKPTILLADEPTGAIDHSMTKSILELFYLINKYAKTTVIIITHNKLIAQMAQRVLYVENGMIVKDIINQKPKMVNEIKGL